MSKRSLFNTIKFMNLILFSFSFFILFFSLPVWAQVPSAEQASGQESLRQMQERDQRLRQQLEKKEFVPAAESPVLIPQEPSATDVSQKVLVNAIVVTGNTILTEQELRNTIVPYEGKELSLSDMQKVADLLTDAYRQKGFITTRAILPPQQVSGNTLNLQVVEGLVGDVQVRGNRYFRKNIFIKRISLKKGQLFNYDKLRGDLSYINQFPDRNVKTTITPGQEPGQTDVVLDVKDRLPIHVGFSYDNYASRYVGKNRYTGTVTNNNLLGFDDMLTFQYQAAEANAYRLSSFRYLLPVTKSTDIGFYAARNQLSIGEEFKDLLARGKSAIYSFFTNHTLLNQENLKVVASTGFDYKDVFNFQLGVETSRDRLRIPKLGITVDYADAFGGRNIISDELSYGVPDIMGGMDATDVRSTRVGAGGEFVKDRLDLLRLQQLPLNTTLLLKGQLQFAGSILPSSEQYQLGGISNVRGFASGEAVGDNGQSATAEFTFPFYGVPPSVQFPLSKAKVYDALRLAAFYDWGHVRLRNPQAGELKDKSLDSVGCGLRLTLPESLSFRLDFAWPVNGRPSDGHNQHTWVAVSKDF